MVDIADFRFNDPGTSFRAGYGQVNALRQDQAKRAAGNALAGGDYASAAGDLYRNGDIAGGFTVANAGQAQDAMKAKTEADSQAGQVKAWADAAERLSSLHQQLTQQDPQNAVTRTLASFDQMAPQLKAAGVDDGDIAQARQHLGQDPQGTLTALGAGAAKQLGYDIIQTKDGDILAVNKSNPKDTRLVASANAAAPQPPTGPTAAPTGAVAPASGPVDTEALWKAIKHQESGGQASPGTAVGPDTPYGNALGSTQMLPATAEAMARKLGVAWNPALMRENSPKALAYQDQLGRAYLQEGLDKNNGDPAAAAAYYFGGPDPVLHGPKTAAYVQQVLARANPQAYNVASVGATPPPPSGGTAPPPAGAVDANGVLHLAPHQQEWVPDGRGGLKNTKTGATAVDHTYQAPPVAVDPNEVKMVLEGRYPAPTSGRAATDPKWQALLAAAAAEDPQFDAANYATRVKTRQSFLSGPQSQNITALNTVVGHLDALDHSIDKLGNYGGFPGAALNNRVAGFIAKESGTDQRFADFNAKKTAVANELTRVFRGAGGAEADIQGYLKQLDNASSPETLHTSVKAIAELINSRLEAVADSYNQGMGLSKDPMEFLHPEQQRAFARLSGKAVPTAAGAAASAPQADPEVTAALQQARDAIAKGADPAKVKQRLVAHGVNPADL